MNLAEAAPIIARATKIFVIVLRGEGLKYPVSTSYEKKRHSVLKAVMRTASPMAVHA